MIVVAAAAVFILSGCEQIFTYSPVSFLQRDPSTLSEEQKIRYAELALEGGDTETLRNAYEALEGNDDPEVRLLASKLAVGASGINDAIADAVDAMDSGESVDPATLLEDVDTDMLKNAVDSMSVADGDETTKENITSEDYITTAAAAMIVAVEEDGTDLSTVDWENTTADKDGSNIEKSAYYLEQSGYTAEDMGSIEGMFGGG
jgi:hypothetical protein